MHALLLVTLSMPDTAISNDARSRAHNLLCEDDSFCGEGGRFGSPLCDWFVIGGRWSGLLQEILLGNEYQTAFKLKFPQIANGWYSLDLVNQHREQLNLFWHRFGGKDEHPVTRAALRKDCNDDDAMLLDRRLYEHFLKDHTGFVTNLPGHGSRCDFADLDGDTLDESFIDRKWLFLVDYHS